MTGLSRPPRHRGRCQKKASMGRFEVERRLVLDIREFIGLIGPAMTKVSIDIEPIYRTGGSRRLGTLWAALVSLSLLLGARSTVPAWADPTGRFEEDVEASRSATGDGNAQSQSSSLPDLSAIPDLLLAASGSADTGPRYAINLQSTLEPVDAASVPPLPGFENLRLYATQIEKDGKVWHRLRLGFFDSESSARLALESLRGRYPRAWVTKVAPPAREGFARTSRGAALPSVAVAPGTTRILFTEDSIELSETAKGRYKLFGVVTNRDLPGDEVI